MRTILILGLWGMLATRLPAQEGRESPKAIPEQKAAGDDAAALRFRIDVRLGFRGIIVSSTPEGQVRVTRPFEGSRLANQVDLTEGYYLALVTKDRRARSLEGTLLLRAHVEEVTDDGLRIQVGAAAAKQFSPGGLLVLFRPMKSTTAQLKAAPDAATIVQGGSHGLTESEYAALAQSLNNLKQIGLALHNYHDTYRRFPPGLVYGPDGKPWHSWRVLLLPFLDQKALYDQYRFDEPWDGPNNRNLLEKIPPVYRDPIYGERSDAYTHYAAITGPGTAFPGGITLADPDQTQRIRALPAQRLDSQGATRLASFLDGTSNSVLAGSVSPERKIPWMKPEDVEYTADFPAPGGKAGFAAPYRSDKGAVGVFLRADASAFTVLETAPAAEFRKLFTIADGMVIGQLPTLDLLDMTLLVFEIQHTPAGAVARMTRQTAPEAARP